MNAQSSRGHTICKLSMYKEVGPLPDSHLRRQGGKDNVTSNSEVYFADLAGRENEKETKALELKARGPVGAAGAGRTLRGARLHQQEPAPPGELHPRAGHAKAAEDGLCRALRAVESS